MATVEFDDRGVIVACASCGKKNRLAYERLGDAVRCGECKTELTAPATPIEMRSSADFDRLVAHVVDAGRGRLLGAVVRPVPDGGAGAEEGRGAPGRPVRSS